MGDELSRWIASTLLLGLRFAPAIALAPPFTLVRLPIQFRVLLGVGLSATILALRPATSIVTDVSLGFLLPAVAHELALGLLFVLVLNLTFGSLYLAGRTIDMQAGFGLAVLIDPTTRAQTPLVGTLFSLTAAAIFYALDGHIALLRLMAATLDTVPIGSWTAPHAFEKLLAFTATIFSFGMGFGGAAIITLFLLDLAVAFLSRTVPQMNVLVFGVQVKTLAILLVLPLLFGFGSALLVGMLSQTIEAIASMV